MRLELAKTKNKDHSEVQFLRGKVRELTKQVRTLEKQLTRYNRMEHAFNDAQEAIQEAERIIEEVMPKTSERVDPCDKCDHGEMVIKFDFPELNKKIYVCTDCGASRGK